MTYKDITATSREKLNEDNGKETVNPWHTVRVEGDDITGLNWISKMHSNLRMSKNPATVLTEGERMWTREKFKTLGAKGKEKMLIVLAKRTGSELRTHTKNSGTGNSRVRARRNNEFKIAYYVNNDLIEVSWRNVDGIQRDTRVTANEGKTRRAATRKYCVPPRRIMNNTQETEKLRDICRKSKEKNYPPQEVTNYFEHLRQHLFIEHSDNQNAGERVTTRGRRFIKDEIVGVYEGEVIPEKDGVYVLMMKRMALRTYGLTPTQG